MTTEKAISWLKMLRINNLDYRSTPLSHDDLVDLIDKSIDALEKQEPLPTHSLYKFKSRCLKCGAVLSVEDVYCNKCGQHLTWKLGE